MVVSLEAKKGLVGVDGTELSIVRQCELLGLNRSSLYYEAKGESLLNLELMDVLDEIHTNCPFYGSPKLTVALNRLGYGINHKRIERLMRLMDIAALCPYKGPNLSAPGHKVYPYLLRGVEIVRPNQVWSVDITYIRMTNGFLYLVAIMDWFSRYVLSWRLSNTLDAGFCVEALKEALERFGAPELHNSDQGSQFGSEVYTRLLEDRGVGISMDGRGRAFDNIFIERLWRTVKYEEVYIHDYRTGREAFEHLDKYFKFYDTVRFHQSLNYETPAKVYFGK